MQLNLIDKIGGWKLAKEKGFSDKDIDILRSQRDNLYSKMIANEDIQIDGVEDVLEQLYGKYEMGVVTSSKRVHYEQIHVRTGLRRFFDFELVREDYQKSKPDPEPYLAALSKTSSLANQCVVIEDSIRGLESAKAAGLVCWVIPHSFNTGSDFNKADKILKGIHQIPDLLTEQ